MIRDAAAWSFLTAGGGCITLAIVLADTPRFPWLVLFGVAFALIGIRLLRRR